MRATRRYLSIEGYSDDELEFLKAIDRYKRENDRPNPSWREVLQIAHSLGYRKMTHGNCLTTDSLPDPDLAPVSLLSPILNPLPLSAKGEGVVGETKSVETGTGRRPAKIRAAAVGDRSEKGKADRV